LPYPVLISGQYWFHRMNLEAFPPFLFYEEFEGVLMLVLL
jgi:hypothetical protein